MNNLKGGHLHFSSYFKGFRSWSCDPIAFEPVPKQVEACGKGGCSPHGSQETKGRDWEANTLFKIMLSSDLVTSS